MVSYSRHLIWADAIRLPGRAECARGVAGFIGVLLLLDRLAVVFGRRTAGSLWLLDLRIFPSSMAGVFDLVLGLALLTMAAGRGAERSVRRAVRPVIFAGAVLAFLNGLNVLFLGIDRVTLPSVPPVSFLLAGCLIWVATSFRTASEVRSGSVVRVSVIAALVAAAFPAIQIFVFGNTGYSRPAEVAVVFGARTYANGRLSMALEDRVRTACGLYRTGKVRRLLMSGGPGDGSVHETEAMMRRAIELGVPERAIVLDRGGTNTRETVRNSIRELSGRGRVMVVSEFYHLPRIKLAYGQAGIDVATVPANAGHWLRRFPMRSVLRELPAFWSYYFGGLVAY